MSLDFGKISQNSKNIDLFKNAIWDMDKITNGMAKLIMQKEGIDWDDRKSFTGIIYEHLARLDESELDSFISLDEKNELNRSFFNNVINIYLSPFKNNNKKKNELFSKSFEIEERKRTVDLNTDEDIGGFQDARRVNDYYYQIERTHNGFAEEISKIELNKLIEGAEWLTFKWGLKFKTRQKSKKLLVADLNYKKPRRKEDSLRRSRNRYKSYYSQENKMLYKRNLNNSREVLRRLRITFFMINTDIRKMLLHEGDLRVIIPDVFYYQNDWKMALKCIREKRGFATEFDFTDDIPSSSDRENRPWFYSPENNNREQFIRKALLPSKEFTSCFTPDCFKNEKSTELTFLYVCLIAYSERHNG